MLLEGILIHAALVADIVLVQQIQGRAVLLGQRHGILPGKVQMPIDADGDVVTDHGKILAHRIKPRITYKTADMPAKIAA